MLLVCKQTSCMRVCDNVCESGRARARVCVFDTPETKCKVGPLSGRRRKKES